MCPELFPLQLPEASKRPHVAFRRLTGCAPLPHANKARTTKHSLGSTEHYHLLELSHLSTNLNLTLNVAVVYRRFTIIATQGAIVELQCTSGARVIAILSWKKPDRTWLYEHEMLVPTFSQASGYAEKHWIICRVRRSKFDVHRAVHLNIIPIVKPTRCTSVLNLFILERYSTCFGRPFRPSSGVQDCKHSNKHMSNSYCCLQADSSNCLTCGVSIKQRLTMHTAFISYYTQHSGTATFTTHLKSLKM